MAGEFRIATEPVLRFQQNGDPVCDFWVVTNSQKRDPNDQNKWVDDRVLWVKVTLWKNDGAENAANSYRKSDIIALVCEPALGTYVPTKGPKAGQEVTYVETARVIGIGASTRFRNMPHGEAQRQAQQERPPQQRENQSPPTTRDPDNQWGGQQYAGHQQQAAAQDDGAEPPF